MVIGRLRRHRQEQLKWSAMMGRLHATLPVTLATAASSANVMPTGRELDAVELAQEVEMPESRRYSPSVTASRPISSLATARRMHASTARRPRRVERLFLVALARFAQVRGTKEAADLVGVEGRSHEPYCAVIPAVRITFSQRWRSSRRNVATSPGVMAAGSSPASTRRFCTSGILQDFHHRAAQRVDDRRRRVGRCEESGPGRRAVARQHFRDRRHVGRLRIALPAADADGAQLSRLDVAQRGAEGEEGEIDMAGERRRLRFAAAFVGHVHHLHAGHRVE